MQTFMGLRVRRNNTRQTLFLIPVFLLVILLTGCWGGDNETTPSKSSQYSTVIQIKDGESGKLLADLRGESAVTPEEQSKGLMFRDKIEEDYGMIFVFPDQKIRQFWMKNTEVFLDMIFINSGGEIVHIHQNAIPHDETLIPSYKPASAVLEVKGGVTEKLGIKEGDTVTWSIQ